MSRPILCSVRKGNPRCLRVGSGQLVSSLWFLDVSELEKIQDRREVLSPGLGGFWLLQFIPSENVPSPDQ